MIISASKTAGVEGLIAISTIGTRYGGEALKALNQTVNDPNIYIDIVEGNWVGVLSNFIPLDKAAEAGKFIQDTPLVKASLEKIAGFNFRNRFPNGLVTSVKQLPSITAGTTFAQIGSLEGKSLGQITRILSKHGFSYKGTTAGGYQKFYGTGNGRSRMEVWIRPDGEVVRLRQIPGRSFPDRYDSNGNLTNNHNIGERIKLDK